MSVGQTPPSGKGPRTKAAKAPKGQAPSNGPGDNRTRASQQARKKKGSVRASSSQPPSGEKNRSDAPGPSSGSGPRTNGSRNQQRPNARDTFYQSPPRQERTVRAQEPQQRSEEREDERVREDTEVLPIGSATFYTRNGEPLDADIMPDGRLTSLDPNLGVDEETDPSEREDTPPPSDLQPPVGQLMGQISADGQYELNNPSYSPAQQGNIFEGADLSIYDTQDPLGKQLSDTQRGIAEANSFELLLPDSAKVDASGRPLDGSGVKVVVLDAPDDHSIGVQQTINNIAPGAVTYPVATNDFSHSEYKEVGENDSFRDTEIGYIKTDIDTMREDFEGVIAKYKPDLVNLSVAHYKIMWGESLLEDIENPDLTDKARADPTLSQLVDSEMSYNDKLKVAVNYVDELFNTSPEIRSSLQEWYRATSDAANSPDGPILVVAAGNWARDAQRLGLTKGEGMNTYAFGPNVISVAASHPNGTADLRDDTIAPFSSVGTPNNHPLIAAPGQMNLIGKGLLSTADVNGVTSGSSFAAPEVTATIALMLDKDPTLTFQQVKSILSSTAVDTPAPVEREGFGMMDPAAALDSVPDPEESV